MHQHKIILVIVILLLILSTACTNDEESESATNFTGMAPTLEATPTGEESAIVGQVVSISGRSPEPLKGTEVRLAAVFWDENQAEGAFVIDAATSPTVFTDENGGFIFMKIEPRDYVIVVGDLYGQNVILANPDGSAVIYTAEPGKSLDVGTLEVDLESAPSIIPTPYEIYPAPIITTTPDPEKYP